MQLVDASRTHKGRKLRFCGVCIWTDYWGTYVNFCNTGLITSDKSGEKYQLCDPCFLAAAFRYNALSFIYLLLFLVLPLMPSPTTKSMRGHTGRFIIAILLLSLMTTISHLSFQIYLLADQPYGEFLINCERLEVIFRYIGFIRYNDLDVLNVARHIVPEIIVLIGVIVLFVATRKKDSSSDLEMRMADEGSDRPSGAEPQEQFKVRREDTSVTAAIGIFLDLLLLAAAGIARPSVTNAFYFICFLMFATWIACYKTLRKKFKAFRIIILVYSALHLIALYLYQLKIMQELISPDNFYARLFGLTSLIRTDCADPRIIHFFDQEWASFANPGIILVLYWVLAVQTRNYLTKKRKV
uniref:Piezo TM1-24 domain-containing protein n=1 Tax=Strigamia maritima TaxID=126957 RepID=T1JJ10_STRMM